MALRSSTRVSSGFDLLRHSSPSFGSQQTCSYSNLSARRRPGRSMVRGGPLKATPLPPQRAQLPRLYFHYASMTGAGRRAHNHTPPASRIDKVCHLTARMYVRLLGPCFKTGRLGPFCLDLGCGGVEHATGSYLRAPADRSFCPSQRNSARRQAGRRFRRPEGRTPPRPFGFLSLDPAIGAPNGIACRQAREGAPRPTYSKGPFLTGGKLIQTCDSRAIKARRFPRPLGPLSHVGIADPSRWRTTRVPEQPRSARH